MLVLTRRVGETIVIAGAITVTVTEIGNARVRLGISAPRYIPVDRGEVHERRGTEQNERRAAVPE